MAEWGLSLLAETVELLVSELVSNALAATAGLCGHWFAGQFAPGLPPIRLWLHADTRRVLIQVWDACEDMPAPKQPGVEEEQGRGLLLVSALAEDSGVCRMQGATGKCVWAVVAA